MTAETTKAIPQQPENKLSDPSTGIDDTTETLLTIPNEEPGILGLPKPSEKDLASRLVHLGPPSKKYTLCLDLDHTLVYSMDLPIGDNETQIIIYVRPHAITFLNKMAELFEIVVFTAAEESYAREAVELLDPKGKLIKKLISRAHCVPLPSGEYTKDLRVIADRSLSTILLVDDNLWSFAYQLDNGIPVKPYWGEEDDEDLLMVQQYLEELYTSDDIVAFNRARLQLKASII
jgi:CTD small phosphatase-like protein 2